jgi:hypothetical protein
VLMDCAFYVGKVSARDSPDRRPLGRLSRIAVVTSPLTAKWPEHPSGPMIGVTSSNTQYQLDRSPRSKPIVSCRSSEFLACFPSAVLIFFIAGLLCLLRFERVDNLGAYRIPPETGLLIPSDFDTNLLKGRDPPRALLRPSRREKQPTLHKIVVCQMIVKSSSPLLTGCTRGNKIPMCASSRRFSLRGEQCYETDYSALQDTFHTFRLIPSEAQHLCSRSQRRRSGSTGTCAARRG